MKKLFIALILIVAYFGTLFMKNIQVEKAKNVYVPTIYDIQKKQGVPVHTTTVQKGSFREFVTLSGTLDQSGYFKSAVAPQVMRRVRSGDGAYLSFDGKRIKGRVVSVSGSPNLLTGLYEIAADFNVRLKVASAVTIDVPVTEVKGAILIPREGINSRGKKPLAFVLERDRISPRTVEIAGANGEQFWIKSGLRAGEIIVVSDTRNFTGGEKVNAISVENEL
ncbi:MAG: efflux RND transporter periplasmic adaptor subunit [Bacteriovoracaceae bacterium]|jgi:hypothetical protein